MARPETAGSTVGNGGAGARAGAREAAGTGYKWPAEGLTVVPDWIYTSDEILERELERIFRGRTWNYVALEAEIPNPGDFKKSYVGNNSVVVSRAGDGSVHVFENRCAHRGAEFCRRHRGSGKEFVCPYHQWTYDLSGTLIGIPFRRGLGKQGGMPKDFKPAEHSPRRLNVTTRNGVVFASYAEDVEPFEDYLGEEILADFDATFDGRELRLLGYYKNLIHGNWKMYHENLKDPYHATLLHTYLVTFGLLVAGQKSAMIVDPSGRHGTMASAKGDLAEGEVDTSQMRAYRSDMQLQDGRIMDYVREFNSPWSVTMMTIWPNLIVQRELNTLGVRQIVPRSPGTFELNWTMFGYAEDDEDQTRHRLRQGNLMGPAGFLGLEDNEAIKFVQDGIMQSTQGQALLKLGGSEEGTANHLITESAIRSMYRHYCEVMEL